jgi:PhnB protein
MREIPSLVKEQTSFFPDGRDGQVWVYLIWSTAPYGTAPRRYAMPEYIEGSTRPQSVTTTLIVKDAARAIDFYKRAFGAEELMRMPGPGGQGIMHAELQIGDSVIFLMDEFTEVGTKSPQTLGGATASMYLSVADADSAFNRAVDAGAQEEMAVEDMFWGDRMGSVIDPFGYHWAIATHKEDISPEELHRRTEDFYTQMAASKDRDVKTSI